MTPVELTEDRIPRDGIEETIAELVDLYGGEMKGERATERDFVLPLRRGVAAAGGVECTVSWAADDDTTVTLVCNREEALHFSESRRIENILRKAADFTGSPLRISVR